MLKFIYKTLFISLLSCSLMLVDFNAKGLALHSVQAETVKTDAIKDKDLMGTLTMTAVGTIASRLYTYKMTTDIMLAAAGGAAFIGGEVLAFLKLKEVMKGMEQEITRDKNGNINQEQIAALERLKRSYEEAKKTASTKKTLQMAAAAAFAAAGVAAYTMAATDAANLATCSAGITSSLSAAAAAMSCSAPTYGSCVPGVQACITAIQAYSKGFMTYQMGLQAPGPSGPALAKSTAENVTVTGLLQAASTACASSGFAAGAGATLQAACQPKLLTDKIVISGGAGLGLVANNDIFKLAPFLKKHYVENRLSEKEMVRFVQKNEGALTKYFEKAMNVIFPSAHAELFSAMGIASSAAITFLLATSATLGTQIDMFLLIPQKRAIAWGVLAGLTFAATSATDNVIKQIESNISKIDTILNSMRALDLGTGTTQVAVTKPAVVTTPGVKPGVTLSANPNNYDDIDLAKELNGTSLPCFTGKDAADCKSFDQAVKDLPGYKNLNSESQLQLDNILKAANGFNGTSKITKGSLGSAAELAGSANAMRSALEKAQKNAEDRLSKIKSKINIGDQSKKLSDSIEKGVNDSLKKSNSTPSQMYASMFGGRSGIGLASGGGDGQKENVEELKKTPAAPAGIIDISGSGLQGGGDLGLSGGGSMTGASALSASEVEAYNAATKSTPLDAYDLQENEISKDSSASIFELISNRYQRSGYQRLFEKVKAKEPAIKPVKN